MLKNKLPPSIIDFHVHLFPEKAFDAIWKFFAAGGAEVVYQYYADDCIRHLRERNVGIIVFSNYAHKAGFAGPMNEWNIELLEKNEDLYCFAAYHPDDPDAMDYAQRMLAHPKVVGIKLHFMVQQIYPQDERLFPLYEMVADAGKRLLLHTGNGPHGNQFVHRRNDSRYAFIETEPSGHLAAGCYAHRFNGDMLRHFLYTVHA